MSSYDPYAPQGQNPSTFGQPIGYPPADSATQPYPGLPSAPPAYPAQQYAAPYGAIRPEHPQATVVLVLGILGFFTAITGVIAWVMGNHAKKECEAGTYTMTDQLRIGRILGMVTTILAIVGIVLAIIYVVIFAVWLTHIGY